MTEGKDLQWRQFCRLGEMIGDGLHYEEPWILKEYKQLQSILLPEATKMEKERNKKVRQEKNKQLNELIAKKLEVDKCSQCGGNLKQTRSGAKVVKCINCGTRYKYKAKRK